MIEKEEVYQVVTFILIVLFFDFLERRRPGHPVQRLHDLPLNGFALLVVIIGGETWKTLLLTGLNALHLNRAVLLTSLQSLPGMLKIILGLTLADFTLYWIHRAMHRPGLWRTHIFHHSIGELWWLSGSRTSLLHLLLFAVPQTLIAYYLFELAPWEAGVAFSIGVVVNIWIHTNLWVNLGSLERILITPNYHRLHHGARGLSGKNFGFVFTFWDRMFGTYINPRLVGKDFPLGFVPTKDRLLRMILGL
jgi:sterol desaturase/sphingolipid hydroxylase (fatty acid hydroxylase superfamily)